MENRKIKNATPLTYDGISFKSKLEAAVYRLLREAGFVVRYEPVKCTLWKGVRPAVPLYDTDKSGRNWKLRDGKMLDIRYTPDFHFSYRGYDIFIEAKGMVNDVFYIKKKMFVKWLADNIPKSLYFVVHSRAQAANAINIIKSLKNED